MVYGSHVRGHNSHNLTYHHRTGNWLLDISSSLPPSTTYVGTDVAPHLFANNGPNFAFHVQTVTSPWPASWTSTFDFIHQRLVLSNIPPQSALPAIENLSKLLKPGGYIQLVEPDASSYEGEDRPAHRKLIAVYKEVWEKMGGNVRPGPDLKRWLEEAGLERVEEKVVELNLGAISENKALGEQWVENILTVVEHFKTSVQSESSILYSLSCNYIFALVECMLIIWEQKSPASHSQSRSSTSSAVI